MICKIGNTSQSTIRQFQINGLIDSEGNIIHPDFHRANEEQSKKLPIPGVLFRVEDGKAVFNESLGERIDNLNNETRIEQAPGNPGKIWDNKGDVISGRTRTVSQKDSSRQAAKEKIKGPNIAKKSQEAYLAQIKFPPAVKHPYQRSNPDVARPIAALFGSMKSVTDPAYVEGVEERNILSEYRYIYPELVGRFITYKDFVLAAFSELASEVQAQYDALPVRVEYHTGDKNYEDSVELLDDVHNYGHLWVFSGGEDHPVMGSSSADKDGITLNDKFRAVHDFYGHAVDGYTFGKDGEENAWIEHSKMFTPLAQLALTTETRGQNSWVNYSGMNEDALEKIKLGSTLKKEGKAQGREDMVQAGEALLEEANNEFRYADQKIIILPPRMTDTSTFIGKRTLPSLAYHGGNLRDKSDYLTPGYLGDVPFTGYFFFSDRDRAEARGNRSTGARELSVVDFSQYKLHRPTTEGYWNLKSTLKRVTGGLLKGQAIDSILRSLTANDFGSYEIINNLMDSKEEIIRAFSDFKDTITGDFKRVERFETTLMKIAGFEGIDVRGLPSTPSTASPDSSSEGSVIFDLKEGTYVTGTPETIKSPELPTLTKPAGFKTNC